VTIPVSPPPKFLFDLTYKAEVIECLYCIYALTFLRQFVLNQPTFLPFDSVLQPQLVMTLFPRRQPKELISEPVNGVVHCCAWGRPIMHTTVSIVFLHGTRLHVRDGMVSNIAISRVHALAGRGPLRELIVS
jgi:hypothetical protein